MKPGLSQTGIHGRGGHSNCATAPTYEKLPPAIRTLHDSRGSPEATPYSSKEATFSGLGATSREPPVAQRGGVKGVGAVAAPVFA